MPKTLHDALFKSTFSQVEHAAGELGQVLPPGLVARIDFTTSWRSSRQPWERMERRNS